MKVSQSMKTCVFVAIVTLQSATFSLAFSPVCQNIGRLLRDTTGSSSRTTLKSSEDSGDATSNNWNNESPPPSLPTPPPPVPPKRLDPLMASLTRMDPETARGPTRNIPIFGEVPVDGSLIVLVPAAVIGFLGFVLSIVVAVQSSDLIVDSLNSVADDIAQTAFENSNKVYDESVCRGLCSSQDQDLNNLRSFMEGLRK